MKEISAELRIDPSTGSRTLASLVSLKLVERLESGNDGRYVIIRLTDKGRRHIESIKRKTIATSSAILVDFTEERLLLFADLLEEYADALARYAEKSSLS